ncbi:D-alanyl-D-alanine carboxypeptidase family protein [Lysinibacillus sphaericus]|uniref:D-alanyl-D-alanine carboxypeptidase family protein n=2 Tax=Lysinibacillus sphaericus TaxID=1421 RepID=A0A544V0A9_LYSSH|nr:D-alanyl-D-alanine carboxypeptidase family protein [Lysinibacillus sp. SDF0037]
MKTIILNKSQIYKGDLILVNAHYPVHSHSVEGFSMVDEKYSDVRMKRNAVNALQCIFEKIGCADQIVAVSGHRSLAEQEEIYDGSMRDNGRSFTESYVALPNHSEHHTGLAIDLGLKQEVIDFIRPDFPYEGICNEFRKTAPYYGFIERYQSDKEKITGISHEPWHFRFVGYPHSEVMDKEHLSFEEYIEYIRNFTYNKEHLRIVGNEGKEIEIFFVPCHTEKVEITLPEHSIYQVSGNNVDGFIVTVWGRQNEQE